MPAVVVFDTNALMLPFERRISVEKELERLLGPFRGLVPEPCLKELARIAGEEKGARRDRAKMALALAARFEGEPMEGPPDEAALRLARERRALLFTNDKAVLRAARGNVRGTIRLKGLSHLEVEWFAEG